MPFATDGFETRPLFAADEVENIRQVIASHMDRVARAMLKPYAETEPDAPFDQRIERIAAHDQSFAQLLGTAVATDAFRAPEIVALAHDPRLSALAGELAGCEIEDRIFRLRLNSSALPHGRQAWHSDVSREDGTECSRLRITAWIPLCDAGPGTGGLEIAPGKRELPAEHDDNGMKITIAESSLSGIGTVRPDIAAGDCLLLDRFTPHRALINESGLTRWSLVVWMKGCVTAGNDAAPALSETARF